MLGAGREAGGVAFNTDRDCALGLAAAIERLNAINAEWQHRISRDAVDECRAGAPFVADRSAGVVPLHALVFGGADGSQSKGA